MPSTDGVDERIPATLPPTHMKDINALRLFEEIRLHPWKPNDKVIIDAHLAMYGVTNPRLASELAQKYSDKMEAYAAVHFAPLAPKKEVEPVVVKPVEEPAVEEPQKKKTKGRKSFLTPSHE